MCCSVENWVEKKLFVGSVFVIMTAVINRYRIDFASAPVFTGKFRAQTLNTVIYVSSNFCPQLPALKMVCYFCQNYLKLLTVYVGFFFKMRFI